MKSSFILPGQKYLKLRNDYAFKKVFGQQQNKHLLIPLINHLIPEKNVTDIEFRNTEQPASDEEGKVTRYDILCTDADGSVFIVELQCVPYANFYDRLVVYSSHPLSKSLRRGENYSEARPVYVISILDYVMRLDRDNVESTRKLVRKAKVFMDDNSLTPLTDKLIFIFLQMPLVETISEDSSWLEKYAFTVRNSESFPDVPKELSGEDYFIELLTKSDLMIMQDEEWNQYDRMERDEREYAARAEYAHKRDLAQGRAEGIEIGRAEGLAEGRAEGKAEGLAEGRAEGRAEGLAEGREEGRVAVRDETLRNAMKHNIPIAVVASILNMTESEVQIRMDELKANI